MSNLGIFKTFQDFGNLEFMVWCGQIKSHRGVNVYWGWQCPSPQYILLFCLLNYKLKHSVLEWKKNVNWLQGYIFSSL